MEFKLNKWLSSEMVFLLKRLSSRIKPLIPYTIDIAIINPYPFYLTIKYKENEYFYMFIYDIN
jgi:hypothetical protein